MGKDCCKICLKFVVYLAAGLEVLGGVLNLAGANFMGVVPLIMGTLLLCGLTKGHTKSVFVYIMIKVVLCSFATLYLLYWFFTNSAQNQEDILIILTTAVAVSWLLLALVCLQFKVMKKEQKEAAEVETNSPLSEV